MTGKKGVRKEGVIPHLQALIKEKGANASPPNLHYLFKRPRSHVNRLRVSPTIKFSLAISEREESL